MHLLPNKRYSYNCIKYMYRSIYNETPRRYTCTFNNYNTIRLILNIVLLPPAHKVRSALLRLVGSDAIAWPRNFLNDASSQPERDSNLRPSCRKAQNLPLSHHAPLNEHNFKCKCDYVLTFLKRHQWRFFYRAN